MKKIIFLIVCLLSLSACQTKIIDNEFEIKTEDVDMTYYFGVQKDNCFKKVKITEMDRCLKEGGSGIFYLGYIDCNFCQSMVRYLNDVALELGVTVYYIDVYDKDESYFDYSEMYIEDLYDYLEEEDGEKVVYTPHVFTIVNGKIDKSQVSFKDWDINLPSEEQIQKLKDTYKKMFKPFVS